MNGNHRNFEVRMNKINRRHQRLSKGYVMSVNHDGLIIAEPKTRSSVVPWRGILFVMIGALIVKGVMLAQIGAENYEARVATLQSGNQIEQIGAYVLAADPITQWIAAQVSGFMPEA